LSLVEGIFQDKPVGIIFQNATLHLGEVQRLVTFGGCQPQVVDRNPMNEFSLCNTPFNARGSVCRRPDRYVLPLITDG
jgi:hypothetical protein